MANFRKQLQDKCLQLCEAATGNSADTNYVRTFDSYLHDLPQEEFPFIVVNVRQAERSGPGEMGTYNDMYTWAVHIYYLDIKPVYVDGEVARDEITDRLLAGFEQNPRLDNLTETTNPVRFTVYDSNWESILFDSSGQDGYYTFTSELYLSVDTARS